jgi:hypothetical protein
MDQKLEVLYKLHPNTDVAGARDRMIRAFLVKEQIMKALEDWPLTWQLVEEKRQVREYLVAVESDLSPDDPSRRVIDLVQTFSNDLAEDSAVRVGDRVQIAHGQVGDWLMRCPLHFGLHD